MALDVARVRGLYVSLSDGWTYLNAHELPQIPERVASGVATAFRTSASATPGQVATGSHGLTAPGGGRRGEAFTDSARRAVADLVGASADRVVLGPNREVLLRTLADAVRPRLRRGGSVILSRCADPSLNNPFVPLGDIDGTCVRWAEPDLGTGEWPAWQYRDLVDGSTRLVVVNAAHRLLGTVAPVAEIAETVHSRSRAWVLVDASTVAAYRGIDMDDWGADIVLVDCSVFGGPQVSALVFRDTTMFPRLDAAWEDAPADSAVKLELGPLPVGLLGGVAPAVDHLAGLKETARGSRRNRLVESTGELEDYMHFLSLHLVDSLQWLGGLHLLGITGETAGDVYRQDRIPRVSLVVPGVDARAVQQRLLDNRLITTVSPPDPLLDQMGAGEAGGSVTVALGPFNTTADIDQLTRAVASFG
ncbi:aminotransferase class V-fold PLP-dependent enzyme [Corynebacterium pygosceleis]|uniref:Aminotransferase class V-fold PLP-dependent enzyme n=1 Tax=Corynebacterium pygosceleis TaxID=2800406 RepID=A0A9Q4C8F4_9CORY|nr:aminotransferase class V-fold PLP-dependent enzyme [Corynebacterium pygosceleis]MCK7637318.1 aminotransferase class V-fold PLP-dependent enzyme [Corynebacterium pygosceleis]MCK7675968.1 aminotransferase class V-fold PLP-dependent enzyme [Corynebacterium pygosceleis]MCL0119906.1 aminotransferase class V-fold PLP-dependent enzyme [Corynebacterium pygosceleis]MCX7445221.1 aminotransferase class V-fold PLP-dependent enzyme [Corynebacterium pygosceleis]MCX7468354.1 aminotransferase class V-fold 